MSVAIDLAIWRARLISLSGATLITGALFVLVVPLSHWLAPDPEPEKPRLVDSVMLPPPPPSKTLEQEITPEVQKLAAAPRPLGAAIDLAPLATDSPQPIGTPKGILNLDAFPVELDGIAEATVFEVHDLDHTPQLLSNPARVVPYELLRDGIRGKVVLKIIISPEGHVQVLDEISSDHPQLVSHAKTFAKKCRFESPLRNGEPVATAFSFPITF